MNPKRFEGHTPGPWKMHRSRDTELKERYWDIWTDREPSKDVPIGNAEGDNAVWATFEETKTNAVLMAAAPQLLTENQELLELLKREHMNRLEMFYETVNEKWIKRKHIQDDPSCPVCAAIIRIEES